MKNKMMLRMIAVVLLAAVTMPGCYMTGAQLTSWLTGSKGLTGILVGRLYDEAVPTDPFVTALLGLAETATIDAISNRVAQEIPMDPGSVK